MKKKLLLLTTSVCAIGLLAGCSAKESYSKYVTLGEYKGLDLKVIKSEVTEDMIAEEVDTLLEDNATYTEISDRGAQEGDTVNIDYKGTIDGQKFDGGSADDFDLELGSGYLMDELEAGLVGAMAGETKEISVTFPEEYDEEVAGKDAIFTVTVNTVSEKHIPEYTDEFVAGATDYKTIAEYEENLKSELYAGLEYDNLSTAGMDAMAMVMENSTFTGEYPQDLYDSCKEQYDAMNQQYAEMFGIDVADLEMSEEETKSAILDMVNEEMITAEIARKEKIKVSDDDYKQYLEDNYELYGYSSVEEYEESETKESIMKEILQEKVQNFLVENANITEVTEDEYYEDYEDEYMDDEEYYDDEEYLDDEEYFDDEEPGDTDPEICPI